MHYPKQRSWISVRPVHGLVYAICEPKPTQSISDISLAVQNQQLAWVKGVFGSPPKL